MFIPTFRVHNFINSCCWVSGSEMPVSISTSRRVKYRWAKAKISFFNLLCFSSTSMPIYNVVRKFNQFRYQIPFNEKNTNHKREGKKIINHKIKRIYRDMYITYNTYCRIHCHSTSYQRWSVWDIKMQRWQAPIIRILPVYLFIQIYY